MQMVVHRVNNTRIDTLFNSAIIGDAGLQLLLAAPTSGFTYKLPPYKLLISSNGTCTRMHAHGTPRGVGHVDYPTWHAVPFAACTCTAWCNATPWCHVQEGRSVRLAGPLVRALITALRDVAYGLQARTAST